jgi:hypothetical protein
MNEKYWAKVYPYQGIIFKFQAEVYENMNIDDTIYIAKQVGSKKFFTSYSAKKWVEKKIVNSEKTFFIKDYEILRRSWNG